MKKKNIILGLFIILKIVFQYLLINPEYDLHRDEYLHLDQAKHLAWGYESVPPFTSWISWVILHLGNGVFWVKFFPALFGALTIVVVWKIIETLKGNLFALLLGATALFFSVLPRINLLYQPNSFEILCWTSFYLVFIKYIQTEKSRWLYLAAITVAIGFLNKYNIVFLILGMLPAILITQQRKIFTLKQFYFALALAALIVLPNIIWQFQQNFPVIHHLKTLSKTQLVNVNRTDFLKEQILFFVGSLFVIIAAFAGFIMYPPFKKFRVIGWSFLFSICLFVYFKAKGYYSIGLYPVLLAFGAVYLEQLFTKGWLQYLRPVSIVVVVFFFIPVFKIAFPVHKAAYIAANNERLRKFGALRWEDGKDHQLPQDFADMLGWRELALKTDSAFASLSDKQNTIVICDNYGEAGAINYYSKYPQIGAVSFNADYINWFVLNKAPLKNVILIKEANDNDPERQKEKAFFKSVSLSGKIESRFAREKGTAIYILKDVQIPLNDFLEKKIEEEKSKE